MSGLKWEINRRLEEIEHCLYWYGQVSRIDLISAFGISAQQASADFKRYQEMQPGSLEYDASARVYRAASDYQPALIRPSMDDYRRWSEGHTRAVEGIPCPDRAPAAEVVRALTRALHRHQSVEIIYQSLTWERPSSRYITPHALLSDGQRYHVRAWCHSREDFRDFVLTRIIATGSTGEGGPGRDEDEDWNTRVMLRLIPHPQLPAAQQRILEQEYGMSQGELRLSVRLALVRYLLVRLRIDEFTSQRRPQDQQLLLANPEVLDLTRPEASTLARSPQA